MSLVGIGRFTVYLDSIRLVEDEGGERRRKEKTNNDPLAALQFTQWQSPENFGRALRGTEILSWPH